MIGISAYYKPRGMSSYDVIRRLKKEHPGEKIGHGGTLDPLAEGVLIVGVGRDATRSLGEVLKGTEKEYVVDIELGTNSDTDDAEGPLHAVSKAIPNVDNIDKALQQFKGEILQTPPVYSAVKIHGQPAYKRARSGEMLVLEPKKVIITEIERLAYTYPSLTLRIVCGSGVYIRSIARDLGAALATGAYVTALKRTRVGEFTAEHAQKIGV